MDVNFTIGTLSELLTSYHNSMENLSFSGFSANEIFATSPWTIKPMKKSTTLLVNPDIFKDFTYVLEQRYGQPENKGLQHGLIYRARGTDDDTEGDVVTITCYETTHTVSVQGSGHSLWISGLKSIKEQLAQITTQHVDQSPESSPLDLLSLDSLPLNFATSTPKAPQPQPDHVSSPLRSQPQFSEAFTQTEAPHLTICDIQLVCPTVEYDDPLLHEESTDNIAIVPEDPIVPTPVIEPSSLEPEDLPPIPLPWKTEKSVPTVTEHLPQMESTDISKPPENSSSAEPVDVCFVPTIPTSNFFNVLNVEEPTTSTSDISQSTPTHDSQTLQPRPIPKPRKNLPQPHQPSHDIGKPIPKPRNNLPTTPTTVDKVTRTVLILGDSIPKHLDGRHMSRRYKVINRCIPGSNIELWMKLAPIFIQEECPTAVILHIGTNNIQSTLTNECLDLFITLVAVIKSICPSTRILVSSLTTQSKPGHDAWIYEYNARLRDQCKLFKWTYIDNSVNIQTSHLSKYDGLHLNKMSISRLAQNFISAIQSISHMDFHAITNRTIK